jgi:hypothetical protein
MLTLSVIENIHMSGAISTGQGLVSYSHLTRAIEPGLNPEMRRKFISLSMLHISYGVICLDFSWFTQVDQN